MPTVCVAANTATAVAPMSIVERDVRATALRRLVVVVVDHQEREPSSPRRCSRSCGPTATHSTRTPPSSTLPRASLSSGPREPVLRSSGRSLPSLRMCNRKQLVRINSICMSSIELHEDVLRISTLESFVWSSTKCERVHISRIKPLKYECMSS